MAMLSVGGDRSRAPGVPGGRPGEDAAGAARRRARARIDSTVEPPRPPLLGEGRRLTAEERRALQERRKAREPGAAAAIAGEPETAAGPAASAPPPRAAKPVPKMPRKAPPSTVRSRGIVALGAVLLSGVIVLALAGGRLFGSAGGEGAGGGRSMAAVFPPPVGSPTLGYADPRSATPVAVARVGGRAPVVCLDPGHGGSDPGFMRGTSGALPAMREADLALEQAWELEARLQRRGFTVVMTRRTDANANPDLRDVNGDGKTAKDDPPDVYRNRTIDELQARIDVCNAAGADLLVSMHVNGYTNGRPRGFETWYTRERSFGDKNFAFANLVYAHLKEQLLAIGYVLPAEERGVNPDTSANVETENGGLYKHFIMTGPEDPGVLKPSQMPGAIVEALFVSNDEDAVFLADPGGRNAIVTAYENAIVEYFERYPPEE